MVTFGGPLTTIVFVYSADPHELFTTSFRMYVPGSTSLITGSNDVELPVTYTGVPGEPEQVPPLYVVDHV
jgi:hypothetical protein